MSGCFGDRGEDALERLGEGRCDIVGIREVIRAFLHLLLGEGA